MYKAPAPEELRAFMQNNNLTGADIAALTGVNPRTARRWVQPPEYKDSRHIPWSSWALILLLTKNTDVKNMLKTINKWKAEKTGRGLHERGAGGRPEWKSKKE